MLYADCRILQNFYLKFYLNFHRVGQWSWIRISTVCVPCYLGGLQVEVGHTAMRQFDGGDTDAVRVSLVVISFEVLEKYVYLIT